MASTTTQTTIVNRALQMLGYPAVGAITDNDRGARAMNRAYFPVLYSMLRAQHWNFAIKRASLAASATAPIFGPAYYFPLPPDFLDLAPTDPIFGVSTGGPLAGPPRANDWRIEGQSIASDDPGPLTIRYISSDINPGMFDTCFCEAFAANLAINTCEELTQSNTKIQNAAQFLQVAMELAKQRDAYEKRPVQAPYTSWITSRF